MGPGARAELICYMGGQPIPGCLLLNLASSVLPHHALSTYAGAEGTAFSLLISPCLQVSAGYSNLKAYDIEQLTNRL